MSTQEKRFVRWTIFAWSIGVLLSLFLGSVSMSATALQKTNAIGSKMDTIEERENNHYAEVKSDLVEIKADLKLLLRK